MPIGEHLTGLLWTAAVLGGHGVAGTWLAGRLLPDRRGPARALAALVGALWTLTTLGHLLGAVGLLRWGAVLAASVAVGVLGLAGGLRTRGLAGTAQRPGAGGSTATGRWDQVLAVASVAAMAAMWAGHVADALRRGMVLVDNLWYHGPFAARFLQTGGFGDLGTLGYAESRYYPFDAELLHGLLAMGFGNDLLVPLANVAYAVLALLAAWVVGRTVGAAPLAVVGTATVLSLPVVASTNPGQMYNDVMAGALLLAALAVLADGRATAGSAAVAAMALGMAAGAKVTVWPMAGVLLALVGVALAWQRRWPATAAWLAVAVATGGFWPARSWVVHGSPLPFLDLRLGPLHLEGAGLPSPEPSLVEARGELVEAWPYYEQGLQLAFGSLWPLLLAAAALTAVVALRREGALRWVAATALVGLVAFPFLPVTAGIAFVNNVRYLVPVLVVAAVLPALAIARPRARAAALVVCAAVQVSALAADHRGRVPEWPEPAWSMVAAGATIVLLAAAAEPVRRGWPASRARAATAALTVAALVVTGLVLWPVQRHYLDHRFVDAGLPDGELYAAAAGARGEAVAVLGTQEVYPFFGTDLSNEVTVLNEHLRLRATWAGDGCEHWRRAVPAGTTLLAVSSEGFALRRVSPEQRAVWFEDDPAVTRLWSSADAALYRVSGALDPAAC